MNRDPWLSNINHLGDGTLMLRYEQIHRLRIKELTH